MIDMGITVHPATDTRPRIPVLNFQPLQPSLGQAHSPKYALSTILFAHTQPRYIRQSPRCRRVSLTKKGAHVDVRIGIQHSSRELSFASSLPAAEVQKKVDAALQGSSQTLSLTDEKGTIYVIPTASLAYVEIGSEESRRVGFVACHGTSVCDDWRCHPGPHRPWCLAVAAHLWGRHPSHHRCLCDRPGVGGVYLAWLEMGRRMDLGRLPPRGWTGHTRRRNLPRPPTRTGRYGSLREARAPRALTSDGADARKRIQLPEAHPAPRGEFDNCQRAIRRADWPAGTAQSPSSYAVNPSASIRWLCRVMTWVKPCTVASGALTAPRSDRTIRSASPTRLRPHSAHRFFRSGCSASTACNSASITTDADETANTSRIRAPLSPGIATAHSNRASSMMPCTTYTPSNRSHSSSRSLIRCTRESHSSASKKVTPGSAPSPRSSAATCSRRRSTSVAASANRFLRTLSLLRRHASARASKYTSCSAAACTRKTTGSGGVSTPELFVSFFGQPTTPSV